MGDHHRLKPSDFDVKIRELNVDELMKTPRISAISLGSYGPLSVLPNVIENQNIDPESHWFGSIEDWKIRSKLPPPRNRWDRDRPAPWRSGRGYKVVGRGLHSNMAWAYAADFPGNPYYKDRGLLHRTVIALAIQLLRMTEEDIFNEFDYGKKWKRCWLHYHFDFPEGSTQAFYYIADDLPKETRRALLKGLRRQAELLRYYHSGCTNQWTIMLHGHWHMYKLTGEDNYRQLVLRHLKSLIRDDVGEHPQSDWYHVGLAPAGYYRELKGFDGAYNSVSAFGLGVLYVETREPMLLELLRRSFRLRNHLTLAEPDGSIVSPTNMNHRKDPMACKPFFPDAAMCAQFLPEAATWLHKYRIGKVQSMSMNAWRPDECEATVRHLARRRLPWSTGRANFAALISAVLLDHLRDVKVPSPAPPLPHEEPESFLRTFGDEFIFVKRPAYYAMIYPGSAYRGEKWCYKTRRGGGLSALWSPGIGTTVYSPGERDFFNHAFDGTFDEKGKTVRFGTSWSKPKYALDPQTSTLTLEGPLGGAPLSFRRRYVFRDDYVRASLVISPQRRFEAKTAHESFPYLAKRGLTVTLLDEKLRPVAAKTKTALAGGLDCAYKQAGMTLLLRSPTTITLSPDTIGGSHARAAVGAVRLQDPSHLRARKTLRNGVPARPAHNGPGSRWTGVSPETRNSAMTDLAAFE